jgi:hypothetical protein
MRGRVLLVEFWEFWGVFWVWIMDCVIEEKARVQFYSREGITGLE